MKISLMNSIPSFLITYFTIKHISLLFLNPPQNQISEEEKKEGDDEHELKVEDVDQEETTEQKPVVTQPQ